MIFPWYPHQISYFSNNKKASPGPHLPATWSMAVGFSRNAELIKQIRGKLPHLVGCARRRIHCGSVQAGIYIYAYRLIYIYIFLSLSLFIMLFKLKNTLRLYDITSCPYVLSLFLKKPLCPHYNSILNMVDFIPSHFINCLNFHFPCHVFNNYSSFLPRVN